MIKLSDWNRLYRHTFDWVLRRIEPDTLEFYHDTEQEWIEAIKAFNKVQEELFKNHTDQLIDLPYYMAYLDLHEQYIL